MNKLKAFSLIETIITLAIFCMISLIGTFELRNFQKRIIFYQTVKEFELVLEQASRIASIQQQNVYINYFPSSHQLIVTGEHYQRQLAIDNSIQIDTIYRYLISAKGMISPKTIIFKNDQQEKRLKVQMAWGRLIIED